MQKISGVGSWSLLYLIQSFSPLRVAINCTASGLPERSDGVEAGFPAASTGGSELKIKRGPWHWRHGVKVQG